MTGPAVPFREIVLKVHSRCDLACDHCYVYEHADQSWRTRPKTISDHVVSRTARRLAEHARTHALPSVTVILHGGEPLLAGPARLRRVCEEFTSALAGIAELDLRIHTNGLQLSPRYLDLFDEFDVKVGISLDGDRAANDRHRRYADGRSSHPLVLKAVELLRQDRYRHLDLGLLCTIDIANDPVAVLDALTGLEPPLIDFLLPHATWDEPPPRPDGSPTAYAEWLLTVFDRWQEQGRPVPVRLFSSVLSTLSGGPSLTESLGLAPTDLVVVETDGQLEQVDSLKSAYEGAAATGFDVFTHSFDEVAAHPGVRARQLGLAGVSETCRRCPVVRSCGGGLYTHRYRSPGGFDHPSVYCADLAALIRGIEDRTAAATESPAVRDPDELLAAQQDLTRTLLAALHDGLDGRGGEAWETAWALAAEVESDPAGQAALDLVLAHPYTRTWLVDVLAAVRAGRPVEGPPVERLAATVAAAAVHAGLGLAVPVVHRDGRLFLPTLGEVRAGEAGETGTALVRAEGEGFTVQTEGGALRIARGEGEGPYWSPVRRLAAGGPGAVRTAGGPGPVPTPVLDDLDPYRACFDTPAAQRLSPSAADAWSVSLAAAWELLAETVPEQAAEAAAVLTTLTPLAGGAPVQEGRHGYGALGIAAGGDAHTLATALLRGFRRTKLRALAEVTDLYASDGSWDHRMPWREEREGPVPFSRLLSETYERVGLGLFAPRFLAGVPQALDMIEEAAETTVDGKQLLAVMRKEINGTHGTSGRNGCKTDVERAAMR
ncbi:MULTISPECIES: radical SAM/SPASM protein FxsBH, inactivated beta-hydroxylase extension form [Streptomyces]|uniref:radical SAM/SPASM protein FxsBH, inactivated beta-hydroxylase extension form n=1 Tax=Streptomyces TaxID=1883 RepID=UPI000978F5BE|nr:MULTISPECIES: radical SAM/SPASM protein FxsB, inactivated metallohydrolase extension form [Streptomyces]NDZ67869.1 FxsB family radical SAM/SPASM domain protein [Streptomyces cyaneofuscatus]RDV50181.1 FxsB family radical SAM/SPASM domain protein [Streptomyces sp. IB2014 011-12]